MANGPVSKQAEVYLGEKGVTVIPDVVANAGGVIVSCFEWQQNLKGEHWDEAKVNDMLRMVMVRAMSSTMMHAEEKGISLKKAAFQLALQRLLG
jgi:glutamate dehydrogenase/leucine dehydrogenase